MFGKDFEIIGSITTHRISITATVVVVIVGIVVVHGRCGLLLIFFDLLFAYNRSNRFATSTDGVGAIAIVRHDIFRRVAVRIIAAIRHFGARSDVLPQLFHSIAIGRSRTRCS